jgi:hypothetical protein
MSRAYRDGKEKLAAAPARPTIDHATVISSRFIASFLVVG